MTCNICGSDRDKYDALANERDTLRKVVGELVEALERNKRVTKIVVEKALMPSAKYELELADEALSTARKVLGEGETEK